MYRLSSITWLVYCLFAAGITAQNPHGASLKIDCRDCHTPDSWAIDAKSWHESGKTDQARPHQAPVFDHGKTRFPLTGRHQGVNCNLCHQSLVFTETNRDCSSCHLDIHQQSLGTDCNRCHDTDNWLVDNLNELHEINGFPLFGNHRKVDCGACHTSETGLFFQRIGNQCIDCHLDTYLSTSMPNHQSAGYSTDCAGCHDIRSSDWFWKPGEANHLFFPLTGGHAIQNCNQCHINGNFSNTPTDCFSCHSDDFQATTNPDHQASQFSTDCKSCHTTDAGWAVGNFTQHDAAYFPIFSGKHKGEWSACIDCHTTSGNFKMFSCIDCHEHNNAGKLANKHDEVGGYSFNSDQCYACHPKGN